MNENIIKLSTEVSEFKMLLDICKENKINLKYASKFLYIINDDNTEIIVDKYKDTLDKYYDYFYDHISKQLKFNIKNNNINTFDTGDVILYERDNLIIVDIIKSIRNNLANLTEFKRIKLNNIRHATIQEIFIYNPLIIEILKL